VAVLIHWGGQLLEAAKCGSQRNENQNSNVDQDLPKERTVRGNGGNGKG